ncbi:hypothetical protein KUH32_09490 [Thalassococcus sp. CAU 1522]|uniref:DUF1344 domain-containing protein n=1 Tax=Thalassococcus arenae TaxID=2851652 RepID=A0ABS6N7L1_9RHOB|nr:hypothetical protein [Thalassococcus arenae]MBV2360007.1 hypothetical protein [Thalassococcus arenae]
MRLAIAAALAAFTAMPVLADETTGRILAFDRVEGLIILTDKTVWSLELMAEPPSDLVSGDMVKITYAAAGEDGITAISAIEKVEG